MLNVHDIACAMQDECDLQDRQDVTPVDFLILPLEILRRAEAFQSTWRSRIRSGQEAVAVIRDALAKKKMVGIGGVVMARR